MKKIAAVLFYIALGIGMVCGAYCFVYDYLIRDRSAVPEILTNSILAAGLVCWLYVGIYYYFDHKKS